jgi:four helix bundle protein
LQIHFKRFVAPFQVSGSRKRVSALGLQKYEDLIVWQKAMDLVEEVYRIAKSLPNEELYGLSSHMKRAVVSIPSNIAEGQERNTTKDFINYLYMAKGSKGELETQLLICVRLKYLSQAQITMSQNLLGEIGKMLNALIQSLSAKLPSPSSPAI